MFFKLFANEQTRTRSCHAYSFDAIIRNNVYHVKIVKIKYSQLDVRKRYRSSLHVSYSIYRIMRNTQINLKQNKQKKQKLNVLLSYGAQQWIVYYCLPLP